MVKKVRVNKVSGIGMMRINFWFWIEKYNEKLARILVILINFSKNLGE